METLLSVLGRSSLALFQGALGARTRLRLVPSGRLARLASLLALFSRSDEASETLLAEKFEQLEVHGDLSAYEARGLDRLRDLMNLRRLAFGKVQYGKARLRQGFVRRAPLDLLQSDSEENDFLHSVEDITESAVLVAELYWKLFDTCEGGIPELRNVGMQLYFHLFNQVFDAKIARARLLHLTDSIQRDKGVSSLVLGLLRQGAVAEGRQIGRYLLTEGVELEDPNRVSGLYWIAEILWFLHAWAHEKLTHETALRYLYHISFTQPDRGGMLEIDSPFYGEFETVNEMAREAFAYRETLMETVLELWKDFDGEFDPIFARVLETLAGREARVPDQRASWERVWSRAQGAFASDYLYVVEGNLSYWAGNWKEAAENYETALNLNPSIRPALMNLPFAYARMNKPKEHEHSVQKLLMHDKFYPSALCVAGNSYFLMGESEEADTYYEQLRGLPGWDSKVDYYKSTFCLQNGLHHQALRFALAAKQAMPTDASVVHHLSVCYDAVGEKGKALETLKALETHTASWLRFYRFTLERDLGNHLEAKETLARIPSDYFEDPEELEAALTFARVQQDIGLLRHLRTKNPR